MISEHATLRDLRRDVRKRFYALVIAPNAQLADKATYDEPVAELIEVAAMYGGQVALRGVVDALRGMLEMALAPQARNLIRLFAAELDRAILPEAPPDPESEGAK